MATILPKSAFALFFFLLLTHTEGFAQEADSMGTAFYIELAGKGFLSANADFPIGHHSRLTVGLTLLDHEFEKKDPTDEEYPTLTLPTPSVMVFRLVGRKKHFFEAGVGLSISPLPWKAYSEHDSALSVHGCLGYRRQWANQMLFRAGFTPFYRIKWAFLPLAGLSFGYSW